MNSNKIKQLINNLPICEEGKAGVAELVSAITPFSIGLPKQGEIWLTRTERIVIVTDNSCSTQIDEIFPFNESRTEDRGSNDLSIGYLTGNFSQFDKFWVKKLADNPKDYFAGRENILADLRKEFPL